MTKPAAAARTPRHLGRTFHIHTFGCQMNENDSEYAAGLLAGLGLAASPSPEDADILIINTCSVRAKSEEKLFSLLGRFVRLKKTRRALLGVIGCSAQLHRARLLERVPEVDFIAGPDNYHRLAEIVLESLEDHCLALGRSAAWNEPVPRQFLRQSPVTAFVTIMEGCDNFCAYCVVPFTRGREKFRPARSVLAEVEGLAGSGYQEVQLLGQNVNSYRDPESGLDFSGLLKRAAVVPGIEWVRFITSHPRGFSRDMARTMSSLPRVCHQLHLPIQAGATSVLRRMNRGYTREDYLSLVAFLRESMPDIALSTDIIVGFPSETEEEFNETLTALEAVRFANIFSFRYSPRPLTSAAKLPDDVPLAVKKRRLMEVQSLQKKIQTENNSRLVGRVQRVLCQGVSRKAPHVFSGRNEGSQVVNFSAPAGMDCIGRFVNVRITGYGSYSLRGELLDVPSIARRP
jgi:tRNA-2-methylthio-N6-dimethylallyladenosine synthase